MIKMGAGIFTKDTCHFTLALDIGATCLRAQSTCDLQVAGRGASYPSRPPAVSPSSRAARVLDWGHLPTKLDLRYLAIDANYSRNHGHTHNGRGLGKRGAVWGPVLSVPLAAISARQNPTTVSCKIATMQAVGNLQNRGSWKRRISWKSRRSIRKVGPMLPFPRGKSAVRPMNCPSRIRSKYGGAQGSVGRLRP
jgi:hypothetical protein